MAYRIGYRIIQDERDRFYLQRELIVPVFTEIMLLFFSAEIWLDVKALSFDIGGSSRYRPEFGTKEDVVEYLIKLILGHVHSAREQRDRPTPRQRIISTHAIKTGELLNMSDEQIAQLYRTAIMGEKHGV